MILVESRDSQWWITGFDPKTVGNVDFKKQVMIGSVDFSEFTNADGKNEMYEALIDSVNKETEQFVYFDDNHKTLWIYWYLEELA